jgi:hypothetical protein
MESSSMPPISSRQLSIASLNPASLAVAEVARLLSAGGGRKVTPEQVQADIDAGAPVNGDGTIHLVYYTAWLLKEVQHDGD